jgi:hypothetical protein
MFSASDVADTPAFFREVTESQVAAFYVVEPFGVGRCECLVLDVHGRPLEVDDDAVCFSRIDELLERVPPKEPQESYEPRWLLVKARYHVEKTVICENALCPWVSPHYLIIDELLDVKVVPKPSFMPQV